MLNVDNPMWAAAASYGITFVFGMIVGVLLIAFIDWKDLW